MSDLPRAHPGEVTRYDDPGDSFTLYATSAWGEGVVVIAYASGGVLVDYQSTALIDDERVVETELDLAR